MILTKLIVENFKLFHDAVYKPFSSSNEADSAGWAKTFLEKNKIDNITSDRIARLIMATSHLSEIMSNDEKLVVDIDLTVLGQNNDIYKTFSDGVRREYRRVPSFLYRMKRKALLQSFLSKNSIYYFDLFREKFEMPARSNLQQEIHSLK